jgi:methanogenic corrinoid protein MtbC1
MKFHKPLMDDVGRQWSEGSLRIVHGQLASVVVHAHLNSLLANGFAESAESPCLLIATPAGQRCYLGALAVALTAQEHGWKAVFLGYDLPAEEIAAASAILAPQLIALSITCRVNDGFMNHELNRLWELIDVRCPCVIGGKSSHLYRRQIEALGGFVCTTTQGLIGWLS